MKIFANRFWWCYCDSWSPIEFKKMFCDSFVLAIVLVIIGCAGYDIGVEFCTEDGCIVIEPHVVHMEVLEPVELEGV